MEALLIQAVSSAVGGNVAGGLLKHLNLGVLGNSIAGIVGGGLGGQILGALGAGGDMGSIVGSLASGGVGGGALMVIIGMVKKILAK